MEPPARKSRTEITARKTQSCRGIRTPNTGVDTVAIATASPSPTRGISAISNGKGNHLASDVFTLWGMKDVKALKTDVFVLSLSYDPAKIPAGTAPTVAWWDSGAKKWTAAAQPSDGVQPAVGPFQRDVPFQPGMCGYDPATRTAWASVDCDGSFAVFVEQ